VRYNTRSKTCKEGRQ